jgi:hypothetical protein
VELTSNAAKRAIRPGALGRKGRTGTQSPKGPSFDATMMAVVAIIRQQHRHLLAYGTAACEATGCGESAPSLLPTPAKLKPLIYARRLAQSCK